MDGSVMNLSAERMVEEQESSKSTVIEQPNFVSASGENLILDAEELSSGIARLQRLQFAIGLIKQAGLFEQAIFLEKDITNELRKGLVERGGEASAKLLEEYDASRSSSQNIGARAIRIS